MPRVLVTIILGVTVFAAAFLFAETPAANSGNVLELAATAANVAGAPDQVRIEILRWSTDEERQRLLSAWELKPEAAPGAGAGKGAAKGGKGAAKGGGGGANPPSTTTPEVALSRALQETTTVGYLWSSEIAGYALRYAGKVANPDGSQRIILITQRRLGAVNQQWNPSFEKTPTTDGAPNTNDFSVIELRVNAKGEGEGKVSLTGKIAPDSNARIVSVENYAALPVVFKAVRSRNQADRASPGIPASVKSSPTKPAATKP